MKYLSSCLSPFFETVRLSALGHLCMAWRRRLTVGSATLLGSSVLFASVQQTMAAREPWETGQTADNILQSPEWPESFPLTARHLARADESPDTRFYAQPRIVHHIDDDAISMIKELYKKELPRGGAVLDLMSSWTSHLATGAGEDAADGYFSRVSAVGMNADELAKNPALHDFNVIDLNATPKLAQYGDQTFDAIFCSVSVDYLSRPLDVFAELHRVLKPDGLAIFTWSNRMFPTKAISAWRLASEPARLWICGSYFRYSVNEGWSAPEGRDLSPHPGRSDPVYVVSARKRAPPGAAADKAEL